MNAPPLETHYTRAADGTNLAYLVGGAGPRQLVVLNAGGPIPTELLSDSPEFLRLNKASPEAGISTRSSLDRSAE